MPTSQYEELICVECRKNAINLAHILLIKYYDR